jgi:hypothetical protein
MANALVIKGRKMLATIPRGVRWLPRCKLLCPDLLVVTPLHHLPALEMEGLESGLEADVLVCSDHPEAAWFYGRSMPGSLSQASAIEAFTVVQRHQRHPSYFGPRPVR